MPGVISGKQNALEVQKIEEGEDYIWICPMKNCRMGLKVFPLSQIATTARRRRRLEAHKNADPWLFAYVHKKKRDAMDSSADAALVTHAIKPGHDMEAIELPVTGNVSKQLKNAGMTTTKFMWRMRCSKHSRLKERRSGEKFFTHTWNTQTTRNINGKLQQITAPHPTHSFKGECSYRQHAAEDKHCHKHIKGVQAMIKKQLACKKYTKEQKEAMGMVTERLGSLTQRRKELQQQAKAMKKAEGTKENKLCVISTAKGERVDGTISRCPAASEGGEQAVGETARVITKGDLQGQFLSVKTHSQGSETEEGEKRSRATSSVEGRALNRNDLRGQQRSVTDGSEKGDEENDKRGAKGQKRRQMH